jgi:hypothetical protein
MKCITEQEAIALRWVIITFYSFLLSSL